MMKHRRVIWLILFIIGLSVLMCATHNYGQQHQVIVESDHTNFSWLERYFSEAPEAIYYLRDPEEIESYLHSDSINVAIAAITALESTDDNKAVQILKNLWNGQTDKYEGEDSIVKKFDIPLVRLHIAKALWKRDSKNKDTYARYIYHVLRKGEPLERESAAFVLINMKDEERINQLTWLALNDKSFPGVSAVYVLGEIGDINSLPTLRKILSMDVSSELKAETKEAIAKIEQKSTEVRTQTRDPNETKKLIRTRIFDQLRSESHFIAASTIVDLSRQDEIFTKAEKLDILYNIENYVSPEVINKDKTLFKAAVAVSLWNNGDKSKIEYVYSLLNSPSIYERTNAAAMLSQIPERRAVDTLLEVVLKDESLDVAYAAASSLGGIGDPSDVPILEKAKERNLGNLNEAVQRAIDEISMKSGKQRDVDEFVE